MFLLAPFLLLPYFHFQFIFKLSAAILASNAPFSGNFLSTLIFFANSNNTSLAPAFAPISLKVLFKLIVSEDVIIPIYISNKV